MDLSRSNQSLLRPQELPRSQCSCHVWARKPILNQSAFMRELFWQIFPAASAKEHKRATELVPPRGFVSQYTVPNRSVTGGNGSELQGWSTNWYNTETLQGQINFCMGKDVHEGAQPLLCFAGVSQTHNRNQVFSEVRLWARATATLEKSYLSKLPAALSVVSWCRYHSRV